MPRLSENRAEVPQSKKEVSNVPKAGETKKLLEEFEALWNSNEPIKENPPDPVSEFLRHLAKLRAEIPAEDLRRLVFLGLEEKIGNAIEAYDKDALQTFAIRRYKIIISLTELAKVFSSLRENGLEKWRELYGSLVSAFDSGSASYKMARGREAERAVPFSTDPELRFYQVMDWSQKQLRQNVRFRYYHKSESTLEPSEIVLAGVRSVGEEMTKDSFKRLDEAEKEKWYREKAAEVYRGVAAFVIADSMKGETRR